MNNIILSTNLINMNVEKLSTLEYWRDFARQLHIEDRNYIESNELFAVSMPLKHELCALINEEGYVQINPPDWGLSLIKMVEVVNSIKNRGLPTTFAFVYDEFWMAFLKLNNIIESILGPGFYRLPDFWLWHIDPKSNESGWGPHRDKGAKSLFKDGNPKSITIWIPLTDSNALNGCMYIVPADRDPTYGTVSENNWEFKLQDIRALNSTAGSIFLWNQAVLHWGAHSSKRASSPRVSMAMEFQCKEVEAMNLPLMAPNSLPSFEQRLMLIAKQILQYRHMYPLNSELELWANTIDLAQKPNN